MDTSNDPELVAINKVLSIYESLDADQVLRVHSYVSQRVKVAKRELKEGEEEDPLTEMRNIYNPTNQPNQKH